MRNRFLAGIVMVATIVPVLGQEIADERRLRLNQDDVTANLRLIELLKHPTFINLRLLTRQRYVPSETPTDTPAPYKVKDKIDFLLYVTQNSIEDITIWNYLNPFYEYRPELVADGNVVPYSKFARERAERSESTAPEGSMMQVTLGPGRDVPWASVALDDWYDPLGPGRYQLTVSKRFVPDGDWVKSNPVLFEVQLRTPGGPIPAGVTIELVPDRLQPKDNRPYQLSSEDLLRVFVLNNSGQPLKVGLADRYYANRPQLFKDGILVPYCQETEKLIRSKEEDLSLVVPANDFFFEAGTRSSAFYVKLSEWYGPLKPGSYRLVSRGRFEIDGPWTADSKPVLFEVRTRQRK